MIGVAPVTSTVKFSAWAKGSKLVTKRDLDILSLGRLAARLGDCCIEMDRARRVVSSLLRSSHTRLVDARVPYRRVVPQLGAIKLENAPREHFVHLLVRQKWARFVVILCSVPALLCLAFGCLIWLDNRYAASEDAEGHSIAGPPMKFRDCVNLSFQTFSTIGYGALGPTTTWANWVVTLETFVALVTAALIPGLFFLKFSKPKPRMRWTKEVLVGGSGAHNSDGTPAPGAHPGPATPGPAAPTLVLRCASLRDGGRTLFDATFHAVLFQQGDKGAEQQHAIEMTDLPLKTSTFRCLSVPVTLVHELQPDSPLLPLLQALHRRRANGDGASSASAAALDRELGFSIVVFLRATDPVQQSTVISTVTYAPSQLRCGGWRFEDVMDLASSTINLERLDDVRAARTARSTHSGRQIGPGMITRQSDDSSDASRGTVATATVPTVCEHAPAISAPMPAQSASHTVGSSQQQPRVHRAPVSSRLLFRHESTRTLPAGLPPLQGSSSSSSSSSSDGGRDMRLGDLTLQGKRLRLAEDRFYHLITVQWRTVLAACAALYFGAILLFSAFVFFDTASNGGVSALGTADTQGRFGDAWFFAVQTFSTVGFGSLAPVTTRANAVANANAAVSFFVLAVINGIIWAKFATERRAEAVFSRQAVMMAVAPEEGAGERREWDLVFRLASSVQGQGLAHVRVEVSALLPTLVPGGARIKQSHALVLQRAFFPVLVNGEVRHRVDASSPLWGLTAEEMEAQGVTIFIVVDGVEDLFMRDFFCAHMYTARNLRWGRQLRDFMFVTNEGGLLLDMELFHAIESQQQQQQKKEEEVVVVGPRLSLGEGTGAALRAPLSQHTEL